MIIDVTNNHYFLKKVVDLIITSYEDDKLHNGHFLHHINWLIANEYDEETWTNLLNDIVPYTKIHWYAFYFI